MARKDTNRAAASRNKSGRKAGAVSSVDPEAVAASLLAAAEDEDPRTLQLELLRVGARVFGKAEADRSYTPAASMLRQIREIAVDLQASRPEDTEESDPGALLAQVVDSIRAMPESARESIIEELQGRDGRHCLPSALRESIAPLEPVEAEEG